LLFELGEKCLSNGISNKGLCYGHGRPPVV
jgi:hypothetical protein